MGSNILLLAENPKYDPIMLNEDQVSILGVAVGLVKQIN
jgi:SOS-response transcriptional repressor LexA